MTSRLFSPPSGDNNESETAYPELGDTLRVATDCTSAAHSSCNRFSRSSRQDNGNRTLGIRDFVCQNRTCLESDLPVLLLPGSGHHSVDRERSEVVDSLNHWVHLPVNNHWNRTVDTMAKERYG